MTPYEKKYSAVVGKMFWRERNWWKGNDLHHYYQLLFISSLSRKYNNRFQYKISLLKEVDKDGIPVEDGEEPRDYNREAARFHDGYHLYIPVITGVPLEDKKLQEEKNSKKVVDGKRKTSRMLIRSEAQQNQPAVKGSEPI